MSFGGSNLVEEEYSTRHESSITINSHKKYNNEAKSKIIGIFSPFFGVVAEAIIK